MTKGDDKQEEKVSPPLAARELDSQVPVFHGGSFRFHRVPAERSIVDMSWLNDIPARVMLKRPKHVVSASKEGKKNYEDTLWCVKDTRTSPVFG